MGGGRNGKSAGTPEPADARQEALRGGAVPAGAADDVHDGVARGCAEAARLLREGHAARAFGELVRASRSLPMTPRLAAALVRFSLRAGTEAAAITLLDTAARTSEVPVRREVRRQLSRVLRRVGQETRAVSALEALLEEAPEDARARYVLEVLRERLEEAREPASREARGADDEADETRSDTVEIPVVGVEPPERADTVELPLLGVEARSSPAWEEGRSETVEVPLVELPTSSAPAPSVEFPWDDDGPGKAAPSRASAAPRTSTVEVPPVGRESSPAASATPPRRTETELVPMVGTDAPAPSSSAPSKRTETELMPAVGADVPAPSASAPSKRTETELMPAVGADVPAPSGSSPSKRTETELMPAVGTDAPAPSGSTPAKRTETELMPAVGAEVPAPSGSRPSKRSDTVLVPVVSHTPPDEEVPTSEIVPPAPEPAPVPGRSATTRGGDPGRDTVAAADAQAEAPRTEAAAPLSAEDAAELARSQRLEAQLIAKRAWRELAQLYLKRADRAKSPTVRAEALTRLAEVMETELQDAAGAARMYREIVELTGDRAALREQVRLLSQRGDASLVRRALDEAIQNARTDRARAGALLTRGERWLNLGEQAKARKDFEAAEALVPGLLPVLSGLVRCVSDADRPAIAERLRAACAAAPRRALDRLESLRVLAHAAEDSLGDLRLAQWAWTEVLAESPDSEQARERLAALARRLGDLPALGQFLRAQLSREPRGPAARQARLELVSTLESAGDTDAALTELRQAVRFEPGHKEAWLLLAERCASGGMAGEAAWALENAATATEDEEERERAWTRLSVFCRDVLRNPERAQVYARRAENLRQAREERALPPPEPPRSARPRREPSGPRTVLVTPPGAVSLTPAGSTDLSEETTSTNDVQAAPGSEPPPSAPAAASPTSRAAPASPSKAERAPPASPPPAKAERGPAASAGSSAPAAKQPSRADRASSAPASKDAVSGGNPPASPPRAERAPAASVAGPSAPAPSARGERASAPAPAARNPAKPASGAEPSASPPRAAEPRAPASQRQPSAPRARGGAGDVPPSEAEAAARSAKSPTALLDEGEALGESPVQATQVIGWEAPPGRMDPVRRIHRPRPEGTVSVVAPAPAPATRPPVKPLPGATETREAPAVDEPVAEPPADTEPAVFKLIRERPLDPKPYRDLVEHFDGRGDAARAALMREIADALEGRDTSGPRSPRPQLTTDERAGLRHPGLRTPAGELLACVGLALCRLFPVQGRAAGSAEPLRGAAGPGAPAILDALHTAARMLDVALPELVLSEDDGPPFTAVYAAAPRIVVGRLGVRQVLPAAELRFHAGRALFSLSPDLLALRTLKELQLLRALALLSSVLKDPRAASDEARVVREALSPRALERAAALLDPGTRDFKASTLMDAARDSVNRAGLVACGGLGPSLAALRARKALEPELTELLRFAASERYLALRGPSDAARPGR